MNICNGRYSWNEEDILGSGYFGSVYRGRAVDLAEGVAIKSVLLRNRGIDQTPYGFLPALQRSENRRVSREISALMNLNHPNVVRFLNHDFIDNTVYIVMELCSTDLETYTRRTNDEVLPVGITLEFLQQMATGVEQLHTRNLIHRDLKPNNILLSYADEGFRPDKILVKIGDLGLVTSSPAGDNVTSYHGCTPYMAPESLSGHYDTKVDIWALALIVCDCLGGSELRYLAGRSPDRIRHCFDNNQHHLTEKILPKMMAKKPSKRLNIDQVLRMTATADNNNNCRLKKDALKLEVSRSKNETSGDGGILLTAVAVAGTVVVGAIAIVAGLLLSR